MQITDPSELFVGQIIYIVMAFEDSTKINNTTIEKYKVLSYTTTTKKFACVEVEDTKFDDGVDYLKLDCDNEEWGGHMHRFHQAVRETSMLDFGIIPNTYNNHRTYDSLWEAQQYIDTMYGINATTADPAVGLKSQPLGTDYDRAMGVVR